MNFTEAMEAMRKGDSVRCAGWKNPTSHWKIGADKKTVLAVKNGHIKQARVYIVDILAKDWEVFDPDTREKLADDILACQQGTERVKFKPDGDDIIIQIVSDNFNWGPFNERAKKLHERGLL